MILLIYSKERKEVKIMMNFGLGIRENVVCLVDMNTCEVLSTTEEGIKEWLNAYENNYTLQLV